MLRVWPEIVGAIVLLVIAAMGIGHGLRPSPEPVPAPQKQLGCVRFALIFGLTAINPATFVYFTAVAVTLARALRATTAIAVVVGVALASLLWQLLLVSAGAFQVPGDRPRPSDDSPCRQRRYRRIRGCAGRPCVCVMCRPCSAGLATSANDRFGRHWHVDIAFTRAAGDIGMKDAGEDSVLTGRVGRDRFGWGIFDCAVG